MLGRITRSGAVFSPWGITAETRYELTIDLSTLLDRLVDRLGPGDDLADSVEDSAPIEEVEAAHRCKERLEPQSEGFASEVGGTKSFVSEVGRDGRDDDIGRTAGRLENSHNHYTTTPSNEDPSASKLSRAEKRKYRSKLQRKEKRRETRIIDDAKHGLKVRAISRRRVHETKRIAVSSYSASSARRSGSGYIGRMDKKGSVLKEDKHVAVSGLTEKSLDDLISEGFQLIEWDGREGLCLVDCFDRIVVCGGSPRDETWPDVANGCAEVIENARAQCRFTQKQVDHRRGLFPALAAGFAFGLGRTRPSNLTDCDENVAAMKNVISDNNIKRVAGFQSGLLDGYLPELSTYYRETLDGLQNSQPELRRNFANTPYGSITVNFGPRTVSIPHLDYANLSTGMCAITALGHFNPEEGGHLVLWELGIILRFPPGSTVLIPSALIHHSNLPIKASETRYSITQYSAGGLFRWVENGYCSDKDCVIDKSQRDSPWDIGIERLRWKDRSSTGS